MTYIEQLLNGENVEWKKLEEVCEIYNGLTGKNKNHFENGNALYIPYKNIFNNIEINLNQLGRVTISDNEKQNIVKYGDVLFTGSSETPDEVGMSCAVTAHLEEPLYLNSFSFGIHFNNDIQIIPEFAKYLFRSDLMRKQIKQTASGVTRFNISKKRFKQLLIPLPPLSVQHRIVEILDKFTALEAELEANLEAELDCRKRQYEYYRNQLLSFDMLNRGAKVK